MNKIIEEAMTNMIRRIEDLEEKFSKFNQPKTFNQIGLATLNQKKYIVTLGGVAPINMTKEEAGMEIDRLLKEKYTRESSCREIGCGESDTEAISKQVIEPQEVDTDEAGIDQEGFM